MPNSNRIGSHCKIIFGYIYLGKQLLVIACFIIFALVLGCTSPSPTPIATLTITPSSISPDQNQPNFIPTATSTLTTTEAIIIIDAGYASTFDPTILARLEEWASQLGTATGLNIFAQSGPPSEKEILEALRVGKIHLAILSPLAYVVGNQHGWVAPALEWNNQETSSIMFVARKDSGLIPGEPPEVFEQLAGKRPCWPKVTKSPAIPPVNDYIIPTGLLALSSVSTGLPTFIERNMEHDRISLDAAVYYDQCDFAATGTKPPELYLNNYLPVELSQAGVTFQEWAEQMQILYTTPSLIPNYLIGFSSTLPDSVRELITNAILEISPPFEHWMFLNFDESHYQEFANTVQASGLDLETFLTLSPWPTETTESEVERKTALPEGTVVIDILPDGEAPFLPGSILGSFTNRLVLPAIYAELARMDANGDYFPYLVASLPNLGNGQVRFVGAGEDKQLEVEFHLRPGITWQDGQPLTADDLVFSWQLVMQPEWPWNHWDQAGRAAEVYVDSVEALASDRVVYRFMSQRQAHQASKDGGKLNDQELYADLNVQIGPVVPLDYLEVGQNVFPKHLLGAIPAGEIAKSDFADYPVYAGAYRLVEGGREGQPVVLKAFEDFVLGKPTVDQVVLGASYSFKQAEPYWQTPGLLEEALDVGMVQAQLAFPAVRTREEGIDTRSYDLLAEKGLAQVIWVPRFFWETLDFNLDNPHLADLIVRQAIAQAIDRQAIIDLALGGHGELMRSYLPAWHPLYAGEQSLPVYHYDPENAKNLLQSAGYDLNRFPAIHPSRGPLVLKLASMDVASYSRKGTAELIQEQLAEIGIQLEVQFYEWPEFEGEDCTAIRNGRHFDLGMAGWLGGGYYYLWFVEHTTTSLNIPSDENGCPLDKANWSGWRNDRVDEITPLLKDGYLALKQPDRYRQLWAEHQLLWASELPSLPLFNMQRPVVVSPQLVGVKPSPFAFEGVDDTWNIYQWEINE